MKPSVLAGRIARGHSRVNSACRQRESTPHVFFNENQSRSKINAVCVYCGSNTGTEPIFSEAAGQFGKILAKNGVRLVYGGGSVGLMGVLAKSVLTHGGKVPRNIPEVLTQRERPPRLRQEPIVTRDSPERKRTTFQR